MATDPIFVRFARRTLLRGDLKRRGTKWPDFCFEFLTCEWAGEPSEAKLVSDVGPNSIGVKGGAWKIGRCICFCDRCEFSEGKSMSNLEWEFGVAFEKLRTFQEEFEL